MTIANDLDRARDALHAIPPDCDRSQWVKTGMAAHAAGLEFDDFDRWSAGGGSYNAQAARATWRSFKAAPGGVGAGTLFALARDNGWKGNPSPYQAPSKPTRAPEQPRKVAPGQSAAEIWSRCKPAKSHAYAEQKHASPEALAGLRVVSEGDPLRIMGESMAGSLVVPCWAADGTLSTLQLIPPPEMAERLKAAGKPGKLNLPGHSVNGWFTLGESKPGEPTYVVEGIGQAWACWQSTGHRAVCCFGWGNVARVTEHLRQQDPSARLVLVPDVGKEVDAQKIASEFHCAVAAMPESEPNNFDANDLFCRDGFDVVAALLESATLPPKPAPRYKLLNRDDLAVLPALSWRVRGVLPAAGLAGLYGPSASGKSFLAFDLAAAIAAGERWFECRVEAAPVVYAALEGEAGFKLRAQAWEAHTGRALPDGLHMVLQPFKLTDARDIHDLAAVVPAGAVVFIDTLNRAAPTADENSSKDMGEILEGAKRLQHLTNGLVVLIHHTGKNTAAGLRGHSSLFAALDCAVEVSRDDDRREWKVAKSKDGPGGDAHPFRLQVETLGTDEHGDPVTSCTVRADTSADEVKRVKLPQGGNQKIVLSALRPMFKDGISGKPGAPALRSCIELEAAVTHAAAALLVAPDRKAERAREAITGLVARGVLGCNEGWLWLV